jgi:UPF0716 protein FxsA
LGRLLFLVFLIVPMIEIALFIWLGQTIGLWPTLLGVVITALIGSAVIRRQGISLLAEIQRLMAAGQLPARQILDGVMLAVSGALLLTPGYFTDATGFLLLVPAVRSAIYEFMKSRVRIVEPGGAGFSGARPPPRRDGVIDLDDDEWR